ncbi:hypothetical protein EPO66_01860 [bacterium]|nr:MAG: hypothetical protein EPO66_01860 [bacterium]
MQKTIKTLDFIIYWSIVLIPFFMAVAPAPMNVFMGLLVVSFLLKKALKKENLFISLSIKPPLVLFFIITCISLINTVNLRESVKGGVFELLQYILLTFAVVDGLKDKKHLKIIVISIMSGLLFTFCDETWQVFTGHDFVRGYAPVLNIGLIRATASFKDPNTLGVYLSALIPVVLGLALYYYKGAKKAFMIFLSFIVLAAAGLTYSRPTLLAVYVILFLLGVIRRDKMLITIFVIFTLVSPFLLPKTVKEWAKSVDYNPIRFMCNDDRIAVYLQSLNMIKAHPFIGVGANSFMSSYKYYKTYPEYRNVSTLDEMKAHNNILHMAGEVGLTGLGIFFWFLFMFFKCSIRIYKNLEDDYLRIVSLSLSAGIIAFLINGLTESSLYYSRVALIFWFIIGLSLSLRRFSDARN